MRIIYLVFFVTLGISCYGQTSRLALKVEQLTSGAKHHFFGYIGQCRTIPWNESGRYISGLEVDSIHLMPYAEEAAEVFMIDTKNDNKIIYLDKTHAWNHQHGTMFFWNPKAAETQFFFNDRDIQIVGIAESNTDMSGRYAETYKIDKNLLFVSLDEMLAMQMASHTMEAIEAARMPALWILTKGNHDIAEPGAQEALRFG